MKKFIKKAWMHGEIANIKKLNNDYLTFCPDKKQQILSNERRDIRAVFAIRFLYISILFSIIISIYMLNPAVFILALFVSVLSTQLIAGI